VTQSDGRSSSLSNSSYHDAPAILPETPITIFDDTTAASSPDSVSVPNILVLGPASTNTGTGSIRAAHHDRWSSNASALSDYSETTSQRSSSTATASSDEKQLFRLRCLILKAALNTGYIRHHSETSDDSNNDSSTINTSTTSSSSSQQPSSQRTLQAFVKELSPDAFGSLPWQSQVLESYRKLVLADPSLKRVDSPSFLGGKADGTKKITARDCARAIKWLGPNPKWVWMRDLFRLVFGFGVEEVERSGSVIMV